MSATAPALDTTLFRQQNGVQLIDSKLEGFALSDLPNGVFGFTYAPAMETPLFRNRAYQSFEVHRAKDGNVYLIGFVQPAELKAVETGQSDVRFYPEPYGDATELVCLPLSRIALKRRQLHREAGNWLPLVVYKD